jgi:hypothetical protein
MEVQNEVTRAQSQLAADLVRHNIARALGEDEAYTAKRWGENSTPARWAKAAVSGSVPASLNFSRDAFFATAAEQIVPLQIAAARRVEFDTRIILPTTNSTGYWVGEGDPQPVSRTVIEGGTLTAKRAGGLVVVPRESLTDPRAEPRVVADLQRALAGIVNTAFLSADDATGSTPAGLLYQVDGNASTGDLQTDFAALVDDFGGDLSRAAIITDPVTAVAIGLSGGVFQRAGVNGGDIAGIPLIVSRDSPRDSNGGQIVLVDGSGLSLGMDEFEMTPSTAATILMSDAPATDDPAVWVSMFQNELQAFRLSVRANWVMSRLEGVSVITGAAYGAS